MNTKLTSLFAIVLCFAAITPASASFTGVYDVSNWTTTLTPAGSDGTVDTTGAPNSIILTSGNNCTGTCNGFASNVDFTIAAAAAGNVTFHWSYQTSDSEGSIYDPFGYLLNGAFYQLSTDGQPLNTIEAANSSFAVSTGDIFGFRAQSVDSIPGPGVTTVSNFNGPTATVVTSAPEPATLALVCLGLVGIGFRRRQAA